MVSTTVERVPQSTSRQVNQQIRRQTEENIARYAAADPEHIDRRLAELDQEWDVERIIETESAITILSGLLLANTVNRKFVLVPIFAGSMVLLHNLQGWYPLLPLLRRMGFRTASEINSERYALKAMRGDFR